MKRYHPKMLWMFSIAVAAAIVIFAVIDLLFSKMIGEMVLVKNIEYVDKISEKLVNEVEYMGEKSSSVFNFLQYSNLPQRYFKSENTSHYFDASREMYDFLISVNVIYPELDDIVMIGKRVLCSKMRYRDIYRLIDEDQNGSENISCKGIMLQEGINGERYKVITFLSEIYGNETGKEQYARPIGKSIVSIRLGNLKWLEIDNKGNTSFLLLDKDLNFYPINCDDDKAAEIISHIDKDNIGNKLDNKRFLLTAQEVGDSSLSIVSYTDKAELLSDTSYVQGLILALGAVSVILLMIITAAVYHYVILPIFVLKNHMLTVARGDYTKIKRNIEVEGSKEIVQLSQAFNAMTDEIHDRTLRLFNTTNSLYEMEMEKQRAEIAFLRSQINPHFLYNSLETLKGLCMRNGLTEAANVTNCLGKIFRYSIKGGSVVKLKDELEIAKAYIEIQKSRFPQKVEVIYNFAEETLNIPIIPMLLQPIVENVFEHSVEKNTETTILYLASTIKKGELFLTVQDNGVGIASKKLDELRSILGSDIAYNSGGVGIINVDLRIRMMYGQGYGVTVESSLGEGTKMTLHLKCTIDPDKLGIIPERNEPKDV